MLSQRTSPGGYTRPAPGSYRTVTYPSAPGFKRPSQNGIRSAGREGGLPLPPQTPPTVKTTDELAALSDGSLHGLWRSLKDDAIRFSREGYDARAWETELAYVQRELRIRDGRAEAFARLRDSSLDSPLGRDAFWDLDDPSLPEYQPTPPPREWFRCSAVARRLGERFGQ